MITKSKEEMAAREKAEELNNYQPLDVHRWSDYPEVNSAVNALYEELKSLGVGNERLRKKHVKVVVLDLYVKWLVDPLRHVGYYRMRSHYKDLKSRYNKLHIFFLAVWSTPKGTMGGQQEGVLIPHE